jgi:hypothetical protein
LAPNKIKIKERPDGSGASAVQSCLFDLNVNSRTTVVLHKAPSMFLMKGLYVLLLHFKE